MTIKLINHGTEGEALLEGRLDANSAPEAEQILRQLGERFDRLVLNMTKLDYISSAGLRVIKIMHITMHKKGGELVLRNVNRFVMEVFEMTGFAGLLQIE